MKRIGSGLIRDKKNAVIAECSADGSGAVEKQNVRGHNLLSLLIKSNIASDTPESMRMSDSEILSRERLRFLCPCFRPALRLTGGDVYTRDTYVLTCGA
jgi:hypothetical protein